MLRILFALLLMMSAAYAQPIPPSSTGSAQGFSFNNLAAGTTNFISAGTNTTNQNSAFIASRQLTVSRLYIRVATAPATAQSVVATVYVGAALSMSATSLTCTIAAATNSCSDTTDIAVVPEGQSWAIQVVTGATNATAVGQVGFLVN